MHYGCQCEEYLKIMNIHFYVLFSNASQDVDPDNTVGAFTVRLAQEMDLGNDIREVEICKLNCPPKTSKVKVMSLSVIIMHYSIIN